MSGQHINCFSLSINENTIFAGDKSGQLWMVSSNELKVLRKVQAHSGTIQALVCHKSLPLIALLSKDFSISVWSYDLDGGLEKICHRSIREVPIDNGRFFHSESQGIAFHPFDERVSVRTGGGSFAEFDFSTGNLELAFALKPFQDSDIVTMRYTESGDQVMVGSNRGEITIIANQSVLSCTQIPGCSETVHWFEPFVNQTWLIAGDWRRIAVFHPDQPTEFKIGEIFSRDDFEHVCFSSNQQIYASSFDRNIYLVDPLTLNKKAVVYQGEFKIRWIRTLRSEPDFMILQTRNGSLSKIDLRSGTEVRRLQETPAAQWTICEGRSDSFFVAGEGDEICWYHFAGVESHLRNPVFFRKSIPSGISNLSYIKRIVYDHSRDRLYCGRVDGFLTVLENQKKIAEWPLPSAVRDFALDEDRQEVYVATECGQIIVIDCPSGLTLRTFKSTEPLWCLAFNQEKRIVATAEREGRLLLLNADTLEIIEESKSRLPKRMKWLNGDTLIMNQSQNLDRIQFSDEGWIHTKDFIKGPGNTIEDFDWDPTGQYLAMINYSNVIAIYDFHSITPLFFIYDSFDHIKGIRWLDIKDERAYPLDFVVVGRCGKPRVYRFINEQIMALGFLDDTGVE